ncbi:hypothetical protein GW17_00055325 [Ensete ventricosum]|nr:hypothetical protein GW17_00055325 [Ensete ventricosum]
MIKSLLAAIKVDSCEKSLLAAFVQQETAASCDQGRWQREITTGSIMQREMHTAVEGIKEDLELERLVDRRLKAVILGLNRLLFRKLAEGIGSLPGWRKGVRQKKTETHRKIIGGSRLQGVGRT